MNYYIQGSSARAKEIKAAFEAKGCTLYRLISQCDSEDLIYYSLNGRVRCIKKDNLYLFEAHPGYTKLELPVKSKFKVGDCVVNDYCAGKVIALTDDAYLLDSGQGIPFSCEHNAHLWTIEDAKDGDVLVKSWSEDGDSWEKIIIFKKYHNKGIKGLINRPCVEGYGNTFKNGELAFNEKVPYYSKTWTDNLQPASTKQRDLLFQKMKENSCEWDAEKKELKKVTVKPMFKVGDWVVSTREPSLTYRILESNVTNELGELDYKVEIYSNGIYEKTCFIASNKMDKWGHLWTIQDAKDGDVLVDTLSGSRELTILFISINEDDSISAYCGWNGYTFRVTIDGLGYGTLSSTRYVPATKEQRNLFFTKMREAGYQWDSEKEELRKIKPHYDIKNFQPFDRVLVRQDDSCTWGASFFGRYAGMFMCCNNACFIQCIPFNDDTKHLLGTTDTCDEMYINW